MQLLIPGQALVDGPPYASTNDQKDPHLGRWRAAEPMSRVSTSLKKLVQV